MATDHPLFIYRYMDRSVVRNDSPRFRNRIAARFPTEDHIRNPIEDELLVRTGIKLPRAPWNGAIVWESFFTSAPIEEVLTLVTVAIEHIRRNNPSSRWPNGFREFVETAMREEHLGLRIDEGGVIHFAVDQQFEHDRVATLAGLGAQVLVAARAAYEHAHHYMDGHPPDTKGAVRSAFEAVEIVAKQLCPQHKNLHAGLCRGDLKVRYLAATTGDAVERRVLDGMFDSMAEWVTAMHIYRHGQPDNSAPPTEQFAVYALSTGSAHLRLLAEVAIKVGVNPPAS